MAAAGRRLALGFCVLALVAGCEEGMGPFGTPRDGAGTPDATRSVQLVERDEEAPEVFQVSEAGLWDGRPSLGGVWVAHPDVTDPERVIIRNSSNDKFVIGALFRRERENPGPRLQVSSDAAAALGLLAGQPEQLNVTALRRQEVPEPAEPEAPAEAPERDPETAPAAETGPAIAVSEIATAALDAAEAPASTAPASGAPSAAPPAPPASTLDRPYIQIGIFSVEANARRAADQIRGANLSAEVKRESSQGQTFWRVIAGPARSSTERGRILDAVKRIGFTDAYAVRG